MPRAIAVIERDRTELSYEQLAGRSARLASALLELRASSGARVALLAHNCAAYVELLYACWTIGACVVPINARLHPKEVAFILDDADVHVAFVTDDIDTTAIEHERAGTTHFVEIDGPEYRKLLRAEATEIDVSLAQL